MESSKEKLTIHFNFLLQKEGRCDFMFQMAQTSSQTATKTAKNTCNLQPWEHSLIDHRRALGLSEKYVQEL